MPTSSPPEAAAGIDIGSRSIELVVLNRGQVVHQDKLPTTFDALAQCRRVLETLPPVRLVATGYGRKLLVEHLKHRHVTAITEIQAYALGAHHLAPEARTVLDIGGQDTKAIALVTNGKVAKFDMNDRCAAGTGKFLEFMATALQVPLEDFGDFALRADKRIQINSMCTVFAESEATSLMARGEKAANIALGLHLAIVQRTLAMLRRVGVAEPVLFAGGVAHNPCVRRLLEELLGMGVIVPDQPDMVGALGAALHGLRHRPAKRL
ncbi:MAG: acyl-CoA dehydratase activase [Syntrophobacterales bacterium]|jgi:predicted CoA-substrate-specific enzyme activase|nr:acyl-CoA dehydratase activase [Syntrophobacterales bacterium]